MACRIWFLGLCCWVVASAAAAQQKPVAALGRVSAVGTITETQLLILGNQVEGFLSGHYQLISQQHYQAAEEEAFAALDAKQCTEQTCVRLIQ